MSIQAFTDQLCVIDSGAIDDLLDTNRAKVQRKFSTK